MMVTTVVLGAILLYVCENLDNRDRCNLYWNKLRVLFQQSLCERMNGEEPKKSSKCHSKLSQVIERENPKEVFSTVVRNLEKKYYNFHAVKGIHFTVHEGECFGLFGMSGAGKTTILNMMTLCKAKTSGSIRVNGINYQNDEFKFKSQFGYCPQVAALDPMMTTYETLKYAAWVRGIRRNKIPNTIEFWMERLAIVEFRDCQVQFVPSQTRKQLSVAVAMIGNPPVIFLDEPTTGLGPKSRRIIWNCIREYQHRNGTIVLASQSLLECEYLCNRMAVMDQGQITFIGSSEQFRNKRGKGFKLMIKLKGAADNGAIQSLREKISMSFDSQLMQDEHIIEVSIFRFMFRKKMLIEKREKCCIYLLQFVCTKTTIKHAFLW
jgi:ATP-binding cassette, subfamily A (ABC1), member 3